MATPTAPTDRAPDIGALISRLGLALTALLLSVFMLLSMGHEVSQLRASVQGHLETLAGVIARNSEAALMFENADEAGELLAALQSSPAIEQAVLYRADGRVLARFQSDEVGRAGACQALEPDGQGLSLRWCGAVVYQPVERHGERLGLLAIEANLRDVYRALLGMLGYSLLAAAAVIAASVPLWRRLARRIAGPIDALVDVTRQVREHEDYSRRFETGTRSNAEVQDLAAAFNRMLEQLQLRDARLHEELGQRRRAERRLNDLAYQDAVTGLGNRHQFMEQIDRSLARARQGGPGGAVFYLDLDGFKQVNDQLGHDQGDALLRQVGQRLRGALRVSDTLCRLGGDEFALILDQVADTDAAQAIADKLVAELAEPYALAVPVRHVSASMGVCLFPAHGLDRETLLRHADAAMYAAKRAGKRCARVFETPPEPAKATPGA